MSAINATKIKTGQLKSALLSGVSTLFGRRLVTDGLPDKAPPTSPFTKPRAADAQAEPQSPRMRETEVEHDRILDLFEESARFGHVPADALIGQLHANLGAALAETKRQRGDVEEALASYLLRIDARFPVPLPPEPEKPIPPRRKVIRPLADIWTKRLWPRPSATPQ
jgi:hypothetical protein